MNSEFICILFDVQHIKELFFRIELSNKLMCIVGKNSVGKTTLIRAIKNLTSANTFAKTASPYIFKDNSCIRYVIDGEVYNFQYNPKLQVIDTKAIINEKIKRNIYAELPIPHGERFNHFQRLSEIDEELRKSISLEEYSTPNDLIKFLSKIYTNDSRFENLKEIKIKGKQYYFILKENNFYIREDYLSSGEHFIINLYKIIKRQCKLIVIDEIDISLDASAQVNLISELRNFCKQYGVNIVFTTHSLPLIKTLKDV
jgi:ABC-type multidrug transport system ATPase subunit